MSDKPTFAISPHPEAPLFSEASDAASILRDLVDEGSSGRFSATEKMRQLFRQAGFVSLWFYLRVIAAYSGPYSELNDSLHLDMANFYQRSDYPGCHAGGFLFRGGFKSSVWTHGGNGWDALRDPDITIGLASNIIDRAYEFLSITERTFDSNELFAWLYPEYVPDKNQKHWNDTEMVLPNRTRHRTEPTIKPFAVGGSTAGIHVQKLKLDDIIGDKQLNSDRGCSADMYRIGNWLQQSLPTLVSSWRSSRVFIVGTRYANDDVYEPIMASTKAVFGCTEDYPYEVSPDGAWDIYYRRAIEHGEAVFPEHITKEGLEELARTDWWTYTTQYMNDPRGASINELSSYSPRQCSLEIDPRNNEPFIQLVESEYGDQGFEKVYLRDCNVIIAGDPASSESRISSKTSRSALVVLATDYKERRFIVQIQADYVETLSFFDWIFNAKTKFPMAATRLEAQGPYRMLVKLIQAEERNRHLPLNLLPVTATGDKDARIRTELQPRLERSQVYIVEGFYGLFVSELKGFPTSRKKDILDALSIALKASSIPRSPLDIEEEEERMASRAVYRNKHTGY